MPFPADPQSAALVAHIVSQVQQNITFLAENDYISPADAADIISRLPERSNADVNAITSRMNRTVISAPSPALPGPPPPRRVPSAAPPAQKARALWGYNEDGQEPNDLTFSAGETVEIVDETNADWWTGRCRGRQGLFPSNHVEKISAAPSPPPMAPSPYSAPKGPGGYLPHYASQPPPPAPYMMPPPPAPYMAPPPPAPMMQQPPQQQVVQQDPPKKHRFGGLGNTMATAAAGGLGFGAGAAIGGDLVNAIL